MRRSERIEWLLRVVTFGSVLVVGITGAWSFWRSQDYNGLLLFVLAFGILYAVLICIVRRRKLGMLETR